MEKRMMGIRFMAAAAMVAAMAFLFTAAPGMAFADDNPDPFAQAAQVDLADGAYSVDVAMEGGSGKASVDSPALLTVKDGHAAATLRWSSSNYDYMLVDEAKYLPLNEDPMANSEFQIPVLVFDEPFVVVGDTTAMSTPHEVDYTLTFASDSIVEGAPAGFGTEAAPAQTGDTSAEASAPAAAGDTSAEASAPADTAAAGNAPEGVNPAIIIAIIAVVLVIGIAIGVVRGRKNR